MLALARRRAGALSHDARGKVAWPALPKRAMAMRGFGRFLVGFGLAVMVAALAYQSAAGLAVPSAAATDAVTATTFWSFLSGALLSIFGGVAHGRR